jgi:MoaA/NifB/PqqE/SkfB family radical SAM enzyme
MARLVLELTNRCNLRCQHCFAERHAATGDLPLEILTKVVHEGKQCGITHLAFTGGEPTLHRQFAEIVRRVCAAGYTFSLVSNGANFAPCGVLLQQYRQWFTGVTFSLDGAREATHDQIRGAGSYRRVMRAASLCVFRRLPFSLNMVLTARNRHEVEGMVQLATRLGSRGVRFGHLMPTPDTARHGLDLTPGARREVEAVIWRLQPQATIFVDMAPGFYSAAPFFPCAPLTLEEFNVDYQGNMTLCCHLSGYAGTNTDADILGNLHDMSLQEACHRFHQRVATYLAEKRARLERRALSMREHFPCWYCVTALHKSAWLSHFPHHPWADAPEPAAGGSNNVDIGSAHSPAP